ncbi:hypothetical protein AHF37_10580 [Paragonimus kellicotti]|nr:hypothetical protein AHF37_10580 [Paragonimus kellicotti]
MRDLLSRAVEHQGEFMNSEFIDQLSRRLSDALAKEAGYTACLAASKARRGFLDLLYATHFTDTEVGVSLRSRRKASATGLEYRLADWTAVLEGSNTDEDRDLVQDSLIDYEEYNHTCQQYESFEELLGQLKTEWKETAHGSSSRDSSELEIAEEALKSLRDLIDRWQWYIDSLAPGDFGTVAKWTSQAEQWLKATEDSWYQSTSSNKRRGMAGRPTESWRPSSADPPNSPPSFDRIESLLKEESVGSAY